jgi:hypothetical protein
LLALVVEGTAALFARTDTTVKIKDGGGPLLRLSRFNQVMTEAQVHARRRDGLHHHALLSMVAFHLAASTYGSQKQTRGAATRRIDMRCRKCDGR